MLHLRALIQLLASIARIPLPGGSLSMFFLHERGFGNQGWELDVQCEGQKFHSHHLPLQSFPSFP